jgi:Leucine-rich repeat (LRR) protein
LIINRNKIETLPITIANLHKLTMVDAWDNPLYTLPKEIEQISNNLRVLDLRQIPLKERELEKWSGFFL